MDKVAPSVSLPCVDIKALVLASLAVLPLFLWHIVDSVSQIPPGASPTYIAVDQLRFAFDVVIGVVGTVVVALAVALLVQRRSPKLRLFSFTRTALLAVVPFLAVEALEFSITWLQFDAQSLGFVAHELRYQLIVMFLRYAGSFVGVASASRLYFHWRRSDPDALDAKRFAALCGVALALTVVSTVYWQVSWMSAVNPEPPSLPLALLSCVNYFLWALIGCAGVVFLFGPIVIAAVRRAQVEDNALWVVFAAASAAFVCWLVMFGPSARDAWSDAHENGLVTVVLVGVGGGALYLQVVGGDLMRSAAVAVRSVVADLPGTVRKLRNWPYRPDDDEER